MDEVEKIKEELYNGVLENELKNYEDRYNNDPNCTLETLKIELDFYYNHQDEGWCGRGDIQHIEGQARVAALEILVDRFEKENN